MAEKLTALSKFAYQPKQKMPTGIDPLDTILNGGPEQGDLIGIASKQGGGKSTMLLQLSKIMIEEYNLRVAYIDAERGVKQEILRNMDLEKYLGEQFFLTNMCSTYTDASAILDEILKDPSFGLVVIDSITSLVPTKLLEKDVESQEMALKARAMTAFIDKYRGALANANIITFAVVQYRKNLNQSFYGASEYNTAAPMALNHACDVMLHITTSQAKDRALFDVRETANGKVDAKVGAVHYLWAEKNKHAIPNIKVNFPVKYGLEVSNMEYMKRLLKDKKLIERGGSWIKSVAGIPVQVQGENGLNEYLDQNFDDVRQHLFEQGAYDLITLNHLYDSEFSSNSVEVYDIDENET